MRKVFLTFADSRMSRSVDRICAQARGMGVYDTVIPMSEVDLDADFRLKFKDKLIPGSRGYGYWCWKPQVILQTLRGMNEGDVLHYADAGCHLNKGGIHRLSQYFDAASDCASGVLAFQATPPGLPFEYDGRPLLDLKDRRWIKGDLLDFLNVRFRPDIYESQSIGAGIIFFKKCEASVRLVSDWLEVIESDFSLLDDTESASDNLQGFVEHRHDQAIFSILCKLSNVKTMSAYEYWYPSKVNLYTPDWSALVSYPIHARRDRDYGFIRNAYTLLSGKFRSLLVKIKDFLQ
jgi:hypothetical protein